MSRLHLFVVLALGMAVALPAGAQPRPKPSLTGTVVDSTGRPLDGADVELIGSRQRVQTNSIGAFTFADLAAARYWLLVRRIGYYPAQLSLTLRPNESREIRVTLAPRPFELPEVVVRAEDQRYRSRMRDFLWRSRSSFGGRFLTADDIARNHATELGQIVVRYFPFKNSWVFDRVGGWGPDPFDQIAGLGADDFNRRHAGRARYRPDCPPAVALNGGGITPGWAVNDFDPDEVEALEVYREGTTLPIEYSFGGQAGCGLVVVWLKSYARPTSSSSR